MSKNQSSVNQIIVNNDFYRHPKLSGLRNENKYKCIEQVHHKKSIFLTLCDRHSKRNLTRFGKHKFFATISQYEPKSDL